MSRNSRCTIVLIALLAIAAIALTGCGGGDSVTPSVNPPVETPFSPTIHEGYAAYLLGGEYGTAYVPQDSSDHFSVGPGVYRATALNQSGIVTMGTAGAIDWPAEFRVHGTNEVVNPTPSGWVLEPGMVYDADVRNPAGGTIAITIEVSSINIDGYEVHMVAVDPSANHYNQDTNNNHYQVPVLGLYGWAQLWMKDGQVVNKPAEYDAGISCISGYDPNAGWDGNYQYNRVVTTAAYRVYVYDNTRPSGDMGGPPPVTVGVEFIDFTAAPPSNN